MRIAATCVGLLVLISNAARAQTTLTVGEGWVAVNESRSIHFTNLEQVVELSEVPAEADLSSLTLRAGRYPVKLLSWSRPTDAAREVQTDEDGSYLWKPGQPAEARAAEPSRVSCRIAVESPGRRDLDLTYLMTGMSWRVAYTVLVRGDITNEQERLAVDFEGRLVLANHTSKSIESARVRFVGGDRPDDVGDLSDAGFLMLDDSPLSDMWLKKKRPEPVSFFYVVPSPVRISAHAETEVVFARSLRKPADRQYFMKAAEYPASPRESSRPLRRLIVMRNETAGASLPAGPATVFLGGARSALSQRAWFSHTPAVGAVRLDIGPSDKVLGARRFAGRSKLAPGFYDDSFIFTIENQLPGAVSVEIEEEPETALQWTVVSATAEHVVRGRRITFTPKIAAGSRADVRYTLRVREPTI